MRWIVVFTLVSLVGWKAVWLSAGVADVTADADRTRSDALKSLAVHPTANRYRLSFGDRPTDSQARQEGLGSLHATGFEAWDDQLAIWITPGKDGRPGWAGWDDNRNGEVDEAAELGAAWSDDYCVVEINGLSNQLEGRVIDRGAFRPVSAHEQPDRVRYTSQR